MNIKLKGHEPRIKRAKELWLRIATDLNAGMTPSEISKRYKNKQTKKNYTREHIYWIIKQLKTRFI